jgi:cytochrome o ubiquinol oxidase subunit 2
VNNIVRRYRFLFLVILLGVFVALLIWLAAGSTVAILQPKGIIAEQQRDLLVFATLLSLVVIVPVYALTVMIAIRYRRGNKKATYAPDWDHSRKLEAIWWGVPIVIILILSVVTWQSSHALDPFKPLSSNNNPVTIQVVALEWKWLFIYPEQNIATINYIQFPEDTPINFVITADAPMNSFWIPELGGQVYAMNGMKNKLHLQANAPGTFKGSSANLSGEGFAAMKFTAESTKQVDFSQWVLDSKKASETLDKQRYAELSKPSKGSDQRVYGNVDGGLYDSIVMKYMMAAPNQAAENKNKNSGADHAGH